MPRNKLIAMIVTALITVAAILALVLFFHRNGPPVNPASVESSEDESAGSFESAESDPIESGSVKRESIESVES